MTSLTTDNGNYSLITIKAAKLDASNGPELKSEFVMLNSMGVKNFVVDMSECTYCDSSGLRALLVANRICDDAIGTLILFGLQPDVENIFRLSMLHTMLLIVNTKEEAEALLLKKESM